jgi:hypothetical protein
MVIAIVAVLAMANVAAAGDASGAKIRLPHFGHDDRPKYCSCTNFGVAIESVTPISRL